MPSLGADMEAGTLVEWLVRPGDAVARGDVIAVVETQKGAIEIEVFETGTVHDLTARIGATLPVGTPMAVILAEGEAPQETVPAKPQKEPPVEPPGNPPEQPAAGQPAEPSAEPAPGEPASPRQPPPEPGTPVAVPRMLRASPAARVRARELGVDLATIRGSGPGGAIVLDDVGARRRAAPPAPTLRPALPRTPMDEMRRAIAAAMTRAKQTIPHFYLSHTMDAQPAIDFLAARNADRTPADRILLGALFLRAVSLAASRVQSVNGHYKDGAFHPAKVVNPGVAVALRGGGLVAPALMDGAALSIDETMAGMRDLVSRARAGRLKASEMTEGTITVSALGENGPEAMTGVIFPPQVALVGIGAPQRRPWLVGEEVMPRSTITVTLSADHRASDGRQAARFLTEFETLIQDPESL
ncbi:dihydrolipoamide acetyltransferase family protein [Sagittula salina]|nr:dihydrolipoamide acetyltransferase family protein [Sagittula salina]